MDDLEDKEIEDLIQQVVKRQPVLLAGWSPGAEEVPFPEELLKPATPEQQALADYSNFYWPNKYVPIEKQFREFPLFYAKRKTGHIDRYRLRNQSYAVSESIYHGVKLVLATSDYRVYRANNIWKLIWVYYLYKLKMFFKRKKSTQSNQLKLPSYY